MADLPSLVRVGTRGSKLALKQTGLVVDLLRAAWPGLDVQTQVISTYGDQVTDVPLPQMAGEGVFTNSLEKALHTGEIDLAVHSLKDLPTEEKFGVIIGAIPERANPADALISRDGYTLNSLPHGARVGTCSRRRTAQLLHLRPDLRVIDIRGNIDTRIDKANAPESPYNAIVLACAGLERLGRLREASHILPLEDMLPAPGQGALAVQCRDEATWKDLLSTINHFPTDIAVRAERAFLSGLGGGCSLPVAAYASLNGDELHLTGRVIAPDGTSQVFLRHSSTVTEANSEVGYRLGVEMAEQMKSRGALNLLAGLA